MLALGISTIHQYDRAAMARRLDGSAISYALLQMGDDPTPEDVCRFEEISLSFRTSNGTTRRTFRHRMPDVDAVTLELIQQWRRPDEKLRVQDRAASNCLTSAELAESLFRAFPNATLEASDRLLYVLRISLTGRRAYIVEPGGAPLQYICPPFVVGLSSRQPYRCPVRRLIAARAKRSLEQLQRAQRGEGYRVDRISCVHPEADRLCRGDSRFHICTRSVFDCCAGLDVLRTMNILNKAYFPTDQLIEGEKAAFQSLKPGGLWVVGRTAEDQRNEVTFFLRTDVHWEVVARIGKGSEIEGLVTRRNSQSRLAMTRVP